MSRRAVWNVDPKPQTTLGDDDKLGMCCTGESYRKENVRGLLTVLTGRWERK